MNHLKCLTLNISIYYGFIHGTPILYINGYADINANQATVIIKIHQAREYYTCEYIHKIKVFFTNVKVSDTMSTLYLLLFFF